MRIWRYSGDLLMAMSNIDSAKYSIKSVTKSVPSFRQKSRMLKHT